MEVSDEIPSKKLRLDEQHKESSVPLSNGHHEHINGQADSQRNRQTGCQTNGQTGSQPNPLKEQSGSVEDPTCSSPKPGTSTTNDEDDNISMLSGISGSSGKDWKPDMTGNVGWLARAMARGADPREIVSELFQEAGMLNHMDDNTIWRILFKMFAEPPKREKIKDFNTLEDIAKHIKEASNVLVLTGAGVSVSCGIPDFRSKDGVYARLAVDFPDLPDPQAMFDIQYFRKDPRPFFKFAKEIYPGQFSPSPCHKFINCLEKSGKLLRNYTQNIDTLEQVAGISKVVQCHGSFATASCTKCKSKLSAEHVRSDIMNQKIPICPQCPSPDLEAILEGLSKAAAEAAVEAAAEVTAASLKETGTNDGTKESENLSKVQAQLLENPTASSENTSSATSEKQTSSTESPNSSTENPSSSTEIPSTSENKSSSTENPTSKNPSSPTASGLADSVDASAPAVDASAPALDPSAPALDPSAPALDPSAPALDPSAPAWMERTSPFSDVPIMKPDIVFFGEGLSDEFHSTISQDKDKVDLLIVIGSSLKVRPVALIPSSIPHNVPQILINRERLNHLTFDVELLGDCDTIINQLCHMLEGDWSGPIHRDPLLMTENLPALNQSADESKEETLDESKSSEQAKDPETDSEKPKGNEENKDIPEAENSPKAEDNETGKEDCSDSPGKSEDNDVENPDESFEGGDDDWKPKPLSEHIPEGHFLFIPPHRYVFSGAEVYMDDLSDIEDPENDEDDEDEDGEEEEDEDPQTSSDQPDQDRSEPLESSELDQPGPVEQK